MAASGPRLGRSVELTIDSLGARGDGIARLGAATVFVPFTVPGERVRALIEAKRGDGYAAVVEEWIARDAARPAPACPAFGACGGCAWQHLPAPVYAAVKRDLLIAALHRQKLRPGDAFAVEATRISPAAARRRVRFAGLRSRAGVRLGLHPRAGHDVLDLAQCPVAAPGIAALLDPCRRVAATLDALQPGRKPAAFQVAVTLADGGADVTWTLPQTPGLADRERLARFAAEQDLARVSWRARAADEDRPGAAEPVTQRRPPVIAFGPASVELPPDAFLQATREGEAAIRDAVLAAVAAAPRGPAADLFAGCGTLALPLAAERAVHAVDGDAAAIAALDAAARRTQRIRLTTERRDLALRPLTAGELGRFVAAVFDPPRAGAMAQARELARSKVATVVAVSCDPASLARDLRLLVDGGYAIERVVPIDQFLWSPRVEAVAVLRRR
ncbi:MAG: class I SAM-dependent RNA methyltransferase [Alphaproteobacteria bacterium]|nr:class I SAM-dependent RNA methyltransferase [Alphaproteobacteria bacterium]